MGGVGGGAGGGGTPGANGVASGDPTSGGFGGTAAGGSVGPGSGFGDAGGPDFKRPTGDQGFAYPSTVKTDPKAAGIAKAQQEAAAAAAAKAKAEAEAKAALEAEYQKGLARAKRGAARLSMAGLVGNTNATALDDAISGLWVNDSVALQKGV